MLLNREIIDSLGLIHGTPKYEPASVPLSIGTIITTANQLDNGSFLIPPQGMVLATSKETFDLRGKKVIGYTTVKNALSRDGIWALNIGIVDSDWQGPISSVLINFGKSNFELKIGAEFLRMTFHAYRELTQEEVEHLKVNIPAPIPSETQLNMIKAKYIEERKYQFRATMDEKFLMLGELSRRIAIDVRDSFVTTGTRFGWIFTMASATIALSLFLLNYLFSVLKEDPKPKEYFDNKILKQQNDVFLKQNMDLSQANHEFSLRFDSLNNELKVLENKINRHGK